MMLFSGNDLSKLGKRTGTSPVIHITSLYATYPHFDLSLMSSMVIPYGSLITIIDKENILKINPLIANLSDDVQVIILGKEKLIREIELAYTKLT